jgi:WD40 repeat protein
MSTSNDIAPLNPAWIAAIHASETDYRPLGSAVVIDSRRLLTSAHVVRTASRPEAELWVAFPRTAAAGAPRRRVAAVRIAQPTVADLAVLDLEHEVPRGVTAAPLRCPSPDDMVSRTWWAFGFPGHDPIGNAADGTVGASLGYGWVRLDTASRYHVEPGFSGGGLWSAEYEAVIGIVGEANSRGDGRAFSLFQAGRWLPADRLHELARWGAGSAGGLALASWGWTLADDPEARRHWGPRARGVPVESDRGFRFRGRERALTRILAWLDDPRPKLGPLVVTGSPGAGKSAILGRVVTSADPDFAAAMPADGSRRAKIGSIACAVHAKGKTALDVAAEIARAASGPILDHVADAPHAVRTVLAAREREPFNVVIDALDEAAEPRAIVTDLVLPTLEACADVGVRVIVGTRRADGVGSIVPLLGPTRVEIDLDAPDYFSYDDLVEFVVATLQLSGAERAGNPYARREDALPVARRIAAVAQPNYLVAGLIAGNHGMYDRVAARPSEISSTGRVEAALELYLEKLPTVAGVAPHVALAALALAEAPGLDATLWQVAVQALTGRVVDRGELDRFARGAAANFLVEQDTSASTPVYRLFHQALDDTIAHVRARSVDPADDQRALTRAFLAHGARAGWENAPTYLLRSLAGHAVAAHMVDDLLLDDEFLHHADLRRVIPALTGAATRSGRERGRLLRLTPGAITATPRERAASFSVTAALEGCAELRGSSSAPYRARWAAVLPHRERAVLEAYSSRVAGLCAIGLDGVTWLASVGEEGDVRLWDVDTGEHLRIVDTPGARVTALCPVQVDGRSCLAMADTDGAVRLWDVRSGRFVTTLRSRGEGLGAVCSARAADGQTVIVAAGGDGTIRIWYPPAGDPVRVLAGHPGGVRALCATMVDERVLVVSGGDDGAVRVWDALTGSLDATSENRGSRVNAVCALRVDGRPVVAAALDDGTVRNLRLEDGQEQQVVRRRTGAVRALCCVGGKSDPGLVAFGSDDGSVRIGELGERRQDLVLEGHTDGVAALCAVDLDDRVLLASGGDDGTIRLWETVTAGAERSDPARGGGEVHAVCTFSAGERRLLASADDDGVIRIRDSADGKRQRDLHGHDGPVRSVCALSEDGHTRLVSAGHDGTIRLWNPCTGEQERVVRRHADWVNALCPVNVDGEELVASASDDATVRLWHPGSGRELRTLAGHTDWVRALCPVVVDNGMFLASGGVDGTVRIWNPSTGQESRVLDTGSPVRALCTVRSDGYDLLVSAGDDAAVRLWAPTSGRLLHVLTGHSLAVRAVCTVRVGGEEFLASAGDDRAVRLWDVEMRRIRLAVPVHNAVMALVCPGPGAAVVATTVGLLALDITR